MMKDFAKILGSRWLIDPTYIKPLMDRIAAATPAQIASAVEAYREPQPQMVGDIAVINCSGPITHRNSWFSMWYGSSTIEGMQMQFRMALQDPNVKTIVFRVDSPGGTVDLVPEFADEIYAARDIKPVVTVADTMIASAATWLFSGAGTVMVPRSGQIGSIGVYMAHFDYSKMLEDVGIKVTFVYAGEHKIDGNPYQALSESAQAQFQDEVNEIFRDFNATVARNRGVTTKQVLDAFGQGLMFHGKKAVTIGLADKVATFEAAIGKLQGRKRSAISAAASERPAAHASDSFGCSCGINCHCQDGKRQWCGDDCERCEDDCACRQHAKSQALAPSAKKKSVEPDEDGNCPDGYENRDGQCHPIEEASETAPTSNTQAANIAAALAE